MGLHRGGIGCAFQGPVPGQGYRRGRLFNRKLRRSSHFQRRHRLLCAMSPRFERDRDPAELYEKGRRESCQESDSELLKVRATGNECKKDLAQEKLQGREYAGNVQRDRWIAKWTVIVSILALVVSIIAIFVSVR